MNFQHIILNYLGKHHQFILLDSKGIIIDSTNSYFELTDFINESIDDVMPFISVYVDEIKHLKSGEEIEIDCIQFSILERTGIYDIRLSKVFADGKIAILMRIEDRTNHYTVLQGSHQENVKQMLDKDVILRQTQIIHKQNEDIKALIKETHHRIKNNFQIISSLLNFQAKEIEDERIATMFEDVQNRIHSMALLHEKLYQSYSLKNINVEEYVSSLVRELVENSQVNIHITYDVNVKVLDKDIGAKTLVPLGLLINELVTNSLKHAFKGRDSGHISVKLILTGETTYKLIISDNGIGVPIDLFKRNADTLGTELIQIFTEQLMGEVKVLKGPGAVICIEFSRLD